MIAGRQELLSRLRAAVHSAPGCEAESCYVGGRRLALRYANNRVIQPVDNEGCAVYLRVIKDNRVGRVTVDTLDESALREGISRALAMAALAKPLEHPFHLPEGPEPESEGAVFEATAKLDPARLAPLLHTIFAIHRDAGIQAAGLLDTSYDEFAVVNSRGRERYYPSTHAGITVMAIDGSASGYAQFNGRDIARIDAEALARRATGKCLRARDPISLDPGRFDIIIEPPAVAEVLEWMAMTSFHARSIEEGSGCLAGRLGQEIAAPSVTIADDAMEASGIGINCPFDFEGVSKTRVAFFDKGIARSVVHDTRTAARAGTASTGHASLPNDFGSEPIPINLHFAPGTDTAESLLAKVKRGLWITRFHYVNGFLNPREALMTGLTRDGTFLIENGELTRGVRTLRWTESLLRAFRNVDGVTRDRVAVGGWWNALSATVAPTLLIRDFTFTGKQEGTP